MKVLTSFVAWISEAYTTYGSVFAFSISCLKTNLALQKNRNERKLIVKSSSVLRSRVLLTFDLFISSFFKISVK